MVSYCCAHARPSFAGERESGEQAECGHFKRRKDSMQEALALLLHFHPMSNSRRASSFDVAVSCLKLAEAVGILRVIAVAGAATRDEKADDSTQPNADGDGLVGMFMHGLICRPGAFDCLLADATIDFLAPFQRAGETFAGFPNLFSGDVGRGRHEGARVFRERFHVVAD
jgi:hypothetical protein